MEKIENKNYKILTPFKGWVLQNFPFIEADFDALTNYELICKITEYLNNIIYNQNEVQDLSVELVKGYNDLLDYVNNYLDHLDIQTDVNNKLDEMAASGELTEIIKNYIDPYIENQNNEINNFEGRINNQVERINNQVSLIDNKVNTAVSGSPLVASSIEDMTDTSRIYVNTTDGNWYYYNGTSWEIGGIYQSSGIDPTNPVIANIIDDINTISEKKDNLYTVDNIQVGKNWTGGNASNRAVEYVPVLPNTIYTVELKDSVIFPNVGVFEKETNSGASPILVNQYVRASNPKIVITTSQNTHYICLQFEKATDVSIDDFTSNTIVLFDGTSIIYGANDKTARKIINDAITPYNTFKDLANSHLKGEHRFAGYNMRTCVPYNPYVYEHTQEAHTEPYYNVEQTLKQYYQTSQSKLTKNICNNLKYEDIDFTPDDNGFTRIIVGKNSDDLFFVAYVASNRLGLFGNPIYDKLEVTTDFINFRTILKSSLNNIDTDGIILPNMTNIKVASVKQFSNGEYILAINCHDIVNDNDYTHFYRLSTSMTVIAHCQYVNFNGNTVDMVDEFNGNVYDWHMFISNNKALVTTYGNRNPLTDRGRVWYTENNGYSWKQIFETANHLPAGVNAHTHGVMIDSYTNRLYVIVGENYSSIYYSDLGYNTTDNSWTKIDLTNMPCYNFQEGSQVVNGYPFRDSILFGSDNSGIGAIYRFNKLDDGNLSHIESAHEFLPNKFNGTFYCSAELSRRDLNTPLFMCETHENAMLTEEDNELLNEYHKARVVATMDGVHIVEIWTDDTFGVHPVYINNEETTRKYSMCTRGMGFWLLKNGNALLKFSGRDYQYFGGNPMFSVTGNTNDSCKVRIFKDLEKYL